MNIEIIKQIIESAYSNLDQVGSDDYCNGYESALNAIEEKIKIKHKEIYNLLTESDKKSKIREDGVISFQGITGCIYNDGVLEIVNLENQFFDDGNSYEGFWTSPKESKLLYKYLKNIFEG